MAVLKHMSLKENKVQFRKKMCVFLTDCFICSGSRLDSKIWGCAALYRHEDVGKMENIWPTLMGMCEPMDQTYQYIKEIIETLSLLMGLFKWADTGWLSWITIQ